MTAGLLRAGQRGPVATGQLRQLGLRPEAFVSAQFTAPATGPLHREQPRPALEHRRHDDRDAQADGQRERDQFPHIRGAQAGRPGRQRVEGADHREQRHPDVGGEPLPGALRESGRQHGGERDADDPGFTAGGLTGAGAYRFPGAVRTGLVHGPLLRVGGPQHPAPPDVGPGTVPDGPGTPPGWGRTHPAAARPGQAGAPVPPPTLTV